MLGTLWWKFRDKFPDPFSILLHCQAEISSGQISALLEATGNTEVEAFYPIIFANFLSNPDKVATLIASPGAGSGGGGGGGTYFGRFFCLITFATRGETHNCVHFLYQAAQVLLLLLKKKRRKRRKKKRKQTLEEVLICSVEAVVAVTTKSLVINVIENGDSTLTRYHAVVFPIAII